MASVPKNVSKLYSFSIKVELSEIKKNSKKLVTHMPQLEKMRVSTVSRHERDATACQPALQWTPLVVSRRLF